MMRLHAIAHLLFLPLALATGPVDAKAIPIDSFARLPAITSVSMSADGTQIVAITAAPGSDYRETALATWNLEDLDAGPVVTPSGDHMKFIAASALKAGKILVAARQEWTGSLAGCGEGKISGATATFIQKVYLTDASHSDFSEAFKAGTRRIGVSKATERCLEIAGTAELVSDLPLDPSKVIIQQLNGLTLRADYLLYDLDSGRTELLLRTGDGTNPGLFDPRDGKVLTRNELESVGSNEYEQRVLIRKPGSNDFEVHEKLTTLLHERYTVQVVGRDEASGKYYILTDKFSDHVQAWAYDPKARSFDDEPLVAHPEYPIAALVFGTQKSNFNEILGFTVGGPAPETTFVDGEMRAIHDGLKQAFPGQYVRISDYNDDLSRVLFNTSSAEHPMSYHLLLDRKTVQTLGSQRPWIDSDDIGEQRWVTYKARDGLAIPAILDLPAGWNEGDDPLPAIVHPHGGPWSRDWMGWDGTGWVPFLTSRGYAVLRPQYRGSAGLGRKLWLAGDAEWGKAMQDDKDDGAKWLVEQGIADPERIAIFGYSYGGFAAVAATVRPDGPFQCAIAGGPVSDLKRLGNTWSEDRLQRILQGRTVTGMDPMENAGKASLPILMYTGSRDVRTPDWHAKSFHNAIKEHVSSRFVSIKDMPHSLPWYYEHQEQTLGLIENYLANDCGPGGL